MNNRIKILLGVVVLIGAGAAAWFLYLEEWLMAEPPVATAPKPAAAAPAKPGAQPPAAGPAAKPAAGAAAAGSPDDVIAGVMEASGLKANLAKFGAEFAGSAAAPGMSTADQKAMVAAGERIFEPKQLAADIAGNLKKSYDAERMPKFLELLRNPVALKMVGYETRSSTPAEVKQFLGNYDRNKPTPERARIVARIDNASKATELITELSLAMAKVTAERMLEEMEKAGMQVPPSARQQMSNELLSQKDKMRAEFHKMLHFTYRGVPDAELEQYAKLLDSDLGRWGSLAVHNAMRSALEPRGRELAKELIQLAMASQSGSAAPRATPPVAAAPQTAPQPAPAETPAAETQAPAAEAKPAAEPAKVAAAPVRAEPPPYRRPDNLPELYKKYNDLITAVVMRDREAAAELLQDGKNPNARQSDGQTALMVATNNGDADMMKVLLAKGADPNLRGPRGANALTLAKQIGRAELVQLLESHGARP